MGWSLDLCCHGIWISRITQRFRHLLFAGGSSCINMGEAVCRYDLRGLPRHAEAANSPMWLE
jgi:hypothetical protein